MRMMKRFDAYLSRLCEVLGHADREAPKTLAFREVAREANIDVFMMLQKWFYDA